MSKILDGHGDARFQYDFLQGVSRTFALTIPRLPKELADAVANAYLLCRIADTIEDDTQMTVELKRQFAAQFIAVVRGQEEVRAFSDDLLSKLSVQTPKAELELLAATDKIVGFTHNLPMQQQRAISHCVAVMARGMIDFQVCASTKGLPDLATLNRYCYHVAGVVGELLNELFMMHSPAIARQASALCPRAFSLGQALQMTNITKDIWDDLPRGACWLPRDLFKRHGFDLATMEIGQQSDAFDAGLNELLQISSEHLGLGLEYCQHLPKREKQIREFCLWPLAMSLLNLRKIKSNPGFATGRNVKISRRSVQISGLVSRYCAGQDQLLSRLYQGLSRMLYQP